MEPVLELLKRSLSLCGHVCRKQNSDFLSLFVASDGPMVREPGLRPAF